MRDTVKLTDLMPIAAPFCGTTLSLFAGDLNSFSQETVIQSLEEINSSQYDIQSSRRPMAFHKRALFLFARARRVILRTKIVPFSQEPLSPSQQSWTDHYLNATVISWVTMDMLNNSYEYFVILTTNTELWYTWIAFTKKLYCFYCFIGVILTKKKEKKQIVFITLVLIDEKPYASCLFKFSCYTTWSYHCGGAEHRGIREVENQFRMTVRR